MALYRNVMEQMGQDKPPISFYKELVAIGSMLERVTREREIYVDTGMFKKARISDLQALSQSGLFKFRIPSKYDDQLMNYGIGGIIQRAGFTLYSGRNSDPLVHGKKLPNGDGYITLEAKFLGNNTFYYRDKSAYNKRK